MSEKSHPQDSITFAGIRELIRASFELFFEFSGFLKLVLFRKKFVLLIAILAGLLVGYFYYRSKPNFYKISMIVQYNELTKKTYAEILDQLNLLVRNGSDQALASKLQVPESLASTILFVDSRNINNDLLKSDTSTRLKQPFKIIIGLSKTIDPSILEASILSYLNNSPYLKTSREEQRKIYLYKLSFIDSEQQKLDSLKTEYNRFLAGSGISATFYNNAFNPADIYVQSANLASQKESVLRWLNIEQNAVSLIDGFKSFNASSSSISLFKSLVIFGIGAFLIVFIIAFMDETKKKLRHL